MASSGVTFWSLFVLGPVHRRLRLATGCVLLAYVTTHLLNHALGNISVPAMEAVLLLQKWIWQGILGSALLYGSLTIHAVLGMSALYSRRYVGWTRREVIQIATGLAIPALLANHVLMTRVALALYSLDKGYAVELVAFGVTSLFLGGIQVVALVAAWVHGCIGLSFALSLRPWYDRWRPGLLVIAVLLPAMALVGFGQGIREVRRGLANKFNE